MRTLEQDHNSDNVRIKMIYQHRNQEFSFSSCRSYPDEGPLSFNGVSSGLKSKLFYLLVLSLRLGRERFEVKTLEAAIGL